MLVESRVAAGEVALAVGRGSEPGPPLVLLHGVTRTWRDFLNIWPPLATRWQVWGLDLRGHGDSDRAPAGAYRVDDYSRDVVHLLRHEVRQPAVIWGHSLGSLVALKVAEQIPVRALVLEDPPLELLDARIERSNYRDMFQAWANWAREGLDPAGWLARLAVQLVAVPGSDELVPLAQIRDPASLAFSARWLSRVDPRVFAPLVAGQWWSEAECQRAAAANLAPTLVLAGSPALGGMCPADAAAGLRASLPGGSWVPFEQTGHLIHQFAGPETVRVVLAFLEALPDERG